MVSVSRDIEAPHELVWSRLADFGRIYVFHPGVETSRIVNDVPRGLGAQRVCRFYDGNTVKETIIAFEERKALEVELAEFSMPLKSAYFRMEVTPVSDDCTRTTITLRFEPRMGVFGWILSKLMMESLMRRDARRVLKGLEDHVRTGRWVGRGGELVNGDDSPR